MSEEGAVLEESAARPGQGSERLLERQAELAQLAALAQTARSGSGRLLLIEGAAGIGKTRLIEAVSVEASREGMLVLSARGAEGEREFGFGGVRQLFTGPLRRASASERRRLLAGSAGLVRPLLLGTSEGDPGAVQERFAVLHGLYWLCANLAERGPLLIRVDDAQWLDLPSLSWLCFLARRLEELPALVVVAIRSGEPVQAEEALDEIRASASRVLSPSPLSAAAVAGLVRESLGEATAEFCQACHQVTGGNPFYVLELMAALKAEGVAPSSKGAGRVREEGPKSIGESVMRRLRRRTLALKLARAVAVLGSDADLQRAATLAALAHEEALSAADALAALNILRPGRPLEFVHPIVRTAIHSDLAEGERALWHRRAAALLLAEGGPPEAVAGQLLESEPAGQAWSVEALREAAQQAVARGAPESALAYLRRALAEPPTMSNRIDVLRQAARAAFQCGNPIGGSYLLEALGLTDEPVVQATIALGLGRALLLTDRPDEAMTVLAMGIDQLGDADPELSLCIEAQLIDAGFFRASTSGPARDRLKRWRVGRVPDSPGGRQLLASLAIWAVLESVPASRVGETAELALARGRLLAEHTAAGMSFHLAAMALVLSDLLGRALAWYDRALDDARARGSLTGFTLASCFRSDANYRAGRLIEAEADARAALAARSQGERSIVAPAALAHLLQALTERGDLEEAEATLDAAGFEPHGQDSLFHCSLGFQRGRLRLAQGRPREGIQDLLACGPWLHRWGSRNPSLWPWRSEAAIALAAVGAREEARRLASEEVELTRPLEQPRSLGMGLRAMGLVEGGEQGLALLQEAVAVLASGPSPLEHARALVDLGGALRRQGKLRDARPPLREGLDAANRYGANALAARAQQELVAAGGRPRRPRISGAMALTPSERRVVEMAIEGRSNPELAQALFISLKTVETHLSRAYDKLGIAQRSELAAALSEDRDA